MRLGLATMKLGFGNDEVGFWRRLGMRKVAEKSKGRRCDLEWVSVWVGVVGDLECLFAIAS